MPQPAHRASPEQSLLLAAGAVLLVVSGIGPHDRLTWVLEVVPILIAVPVLLATRRRFPLTHLAYRLVFLHAAVEVLEIALRGAEA